MHVDGARVAVGRVAPDVRQQHVAREDAARRARRARDRISNSTNVVLTSSPRTRTLRLAKSTRRPSTSSGDSSSADGARHLGAAQRGLDARAELPHRERLGDVVVSPELESEHLVDLLRLGGQHDDGYRRAGPQCCGTPRARRAGAASRRARRGRTAARRSGQGPPGRRRRVRPRSRPCAVDTTAMCRPTVRRRQPECGETDRPWPTREPFRPQEEFTNPLRPWLTVGPSSSLLAMLDLRVYRAAFVPAVLAAVITAFSLGSPPRAATTTLAPDAFQSLARVRGAARPGRRLSLAPAGQPGRRGAGPQRRGADALDRPAGLERALQRADHRRQAHADQRRRRAAGEPDQPPHRRHRPPRRRRARKHRGPVEHSGAARARPRLQRARAAAHAGARLDQRGLGRRRGRAGVRAVIPAVPVDAVLVLGDMAGTKLRGPQVVPWSNAEGISSIELQQTVQTALREETGLPRSGPVVAGAVGAPGGAAHGRGAGRGRAPRACPRSCCRRRASAGRAPSGRDRVRG